MLAHDHQTVGDARSLGVPLLGTYLGGRLVLGTGSSWPQDFLFFAGFFSSSLISSGAGESNDVSDGETVKVISGSGDADRDSKSRSDVVSVIMWVYVCVRGRMYCVYIERIDGRCRQVMIVERAGVDMMLVMLLLLPGIKATLSSRSGTVNPPPRITRQVKE